MTRAPRILLIAHAPSTNTARLASAVIDGVGSASECEARRIPPLEANTDDVLKADALILGTTENFGYMAGAMKDFFDRCYYPLLDRTGGLPYAIYVRAGLDGTGTRRAMQGIIGGLGWKSVQEPMILQGEWQEGFVHSCFELGQTMGAGLELGVL